jgi:predicted nuclease of predicted toxin-antitoxin system
MRHYFVVDANLPHDLVFAIRKFGCEAVHVHRLGLVGTFDADIWTYAKERQAVIISKDQDFANRADSLNPPGLIWIRWRNTRRIQLIDRFIKAFPEILNALQSGEWYFELVEV